MILKIDFFKKDATISEARYGSLDGLRGLLAVGVMIHHSYAAYIYFKTGVWGWTNNALLNHLGQTTVAMFFMITGFLFSIKSATKNLKWKETYLSRIARIFPLYTLIVLLAFFIALTVSSWTFVDSPQNIIWQFAQWMAFKLPNINSVPQSGSVIAGVNWSLAYETMFYVVGIPTIYALTRITAIKSTLIASIMLFFAICIWRISRGSASGPALHVEHFLSGIIIGLAYLTVTGKTALKSKTMKWLGVVSTFLLLSMQHAYETKAIILTAIIFASVIAGASLFGMLKSRAAIWLGDISYCIYLIHGILLWCSMSIIKKYGYFDSLDLAPFVILIGFVSAFAVLIASISYSAAFEFPIMQAAKRIKFKAN